MTPSPRRARSFGSLLCIALWTIGLVSSVHAAPLRIVLLPFVGPQSRAAEAQALKTLKRRGDVVPVAKWKARAKKLFSPSQSNDDIATVGKDLKVDVVVTGAVKRDGPKWRLIITVRLGKTGKAIDRLKYDLPGPRVPPGIVGAIPKELNEALDAAVTTLRSDDSSSPEAKGTPSEPIPGKKPGKAPGEAKTPTAEPSPSPAPSPSPVAQGDGKAKRPRWAPYFDLSIGAVLGGRSFDFDPSSLPRFSSSIVGGLYADFTVFPFAWSWKRAKGVFAGFGLGADVVKPFWPPSVARSDPSARFATEELRVEGGLRWRITLYKGMPRPQLVILAQGGLHSFSIQKTTDPITMMPADVGPPNVSYGYIAAGGGLRLNFAEWALLYVHALGEFPLTVGEVGAATRFGAARVTGVRVEGGLEFFVYRGLKIGLGGYYDRIMFTFVNAGAKQANSAVDQYFGGLLMLGYVL